MSVDGSWKGGGSIALVALGPMSADFAVRESRLNSSLQMCAGGLEYLHQGVVSTVTQWDIRICRRLFSDKSCYAVFTASREEARIFSEASRPTGD